MRTANRFAILSGLLSVCISCSAFANDIDDFKKTKAERFVETENAKFSAMMLDLNARANEMRYSIIKGKCQTPELISFESGVNDFEEFRTATQSSLSRSFAGGDPESTYAVAVMSKTFAVAEGSDGALRAAAIEAASATERFALAAKQYRISMEELGHQLQMCDR